MSTATAPVDAQDRIRIPQNLPIDNSRGVWGMWFLIITETFLFIGLFFAYVFLTDNKDRFHIEEIPTLHYAIPMLLVLLLSSAVLMWGEKQVKRGRYKVARAALGGTILIGLAFMVMQIFEYREHLQRLTPSTDSYGSIFYTITTLHALHVVAGLCILLYVLFLPNYGPVDRTPFQSYRIGAMYWHFVDVVWVFVVAILYVFPHL